MRGKEGSIASVFSQRDSAILGRHADIHVAGAVCCHRVFQGRCGGTSLHGELVSCTRYTLEVLAVSALSLECGSGMHTCFGRAFFALTCLFVCFFWLVATQNDDGRIRCVRLREVSVYVVRPPCSLLNYPTLYQTACSLKTRFCPLSVSLCPIPRTCSCTAHAILFALACFVCLVVWFFCTRR